MGLFLKILDLTGRRKAARSQADSDMADADGLLEELRKSFDRLCAQLSGGTGTADWERLSDSALQLRILSRRLYRQSRRLERSLQSLSENEREVRDRLRRGG